MSADLIALRRMAEREERQGRALNARCLREMLNEVDALRALNVGGDVGQPLGEDGELLPFVENYIRCSRDPNLTPFIKENGLHGNSPWWELREAAVRARLRRGVECGASGENPEIHQPPQ